VHPPAHRRRTRPRTAALIAAGAAALTAAATAILATGGSPAFAGTLSGTFYRDPNSSVLRWLAANPNDSRASLIRDRIGSQPQGRWFANYNPSTIQSEVSAYVSGANSAGQIPLAIAYMIPNRDCGGASAGGAPDISSYRSWVTSFAAGLGNRTAVILLEPDSLALQTCLSGTALSDRNSAISFAVTTIKSANPSAKVYLDGGHSAWNSAGDQANRLVAAGVRNADGFYSNVSNFRFTADEVNYGRNVLSSIGSSNLHQVIDVSRNGKGPNGSEWCDPAGRGTGVAPTTNTGEATVDAFVWAKPPGEADGCAAAAGTFVPDLAFQLASNGVVTSPPPSTPGSPSPSRTSASPSASPSRSASPSVSPSRSPSASPSSSPPPTGGGCSATGTVQTQWTGGYVIQPLTVTNTGSSTINSWTVTFTLPAGHTVTGSWNTTMTVSGQTVTMKNVGFNGTIAPGASNTTVGFQASRPSTSTAVPASYTCSTP
jgi:endoglucanase